MKILSVDTCSGSCSLSLLKDNSIVETIIESRKGKQAEMLIPLLEEICEKNKIKYSDLDAIAITTGPGSFTGVRIGLASIKGVSIVSNIPIIGVTTLETTAFKAVNDHDIKQEEITVLLDAKRGQFYKQKFSCAKLPEELSKPELISISEIEDIGFFISNTEIERENSISNIVIDSSDVALLAKRKLLSGKPGNNNPEPLYIRAPDAILPKAKNV